MQFSESHSFKGQIESSPNITNQIFSEGNHKRMSDNTLFNYQNNSQDVSERFIMEIGE